MAGQSAACACIKATEAVSGAACTILFMSTASSATVKLYVLACTPPRANALKPYRAPTSAGGDSCLADLGGQSCPYELAYHYQIHDKNQAFTLIADPVTTQGSGAVGGSSTTAAVHAAQ